jgi:putative tryptophan/tyrosine transport system substrate-binding protein
MKRREFITLLGGAAAAWPLGARAQQADRMRRIGVLMNLTADDPESSKEMTAFLGGLQELGWTLGGNLQVEYRWGAEDADRHRKNVAELVALVPDVILAAGGTAVGALQQATRTIPIVFVEAADPVNRGLVASLARPGGNTTGFTQFEFSIAGKWLELLKQIAPNVRRAAVIRDPSESSGIGIFTAIQAMAPSLGVEVSSVDARNDVSEIERAITLFARDPNGGMIMTPTGKARRHREPIITLAAQHKLPAVYPYRYYVTDGGLISYGPDVVHEFRLAAGYVDRIFKGEKAADLPVQAATKYTMVINLNTAKTLGLTVPPVLLTSADEVIE